MSSFTKVKIPKLDSGAAGAPPHGSEGRRTPRRVYLRPVGVLRHGVYEVCAAMQLSEGGMLFVGGEQYQVKDHLVLSLVLPSGGVAVARGEIIYARPDASGQRQFGVRFAKLPLAIRRSIRNYVTAKTQEEAEMEKVK